MTARSPFAPYANTQLRFTVHTGALLPDANGNLKPSGAEEVEVTALLKQKANPKRDPVPGVDPEAVWFEGFLVAPRPMPSAIAPHQKCVALIDEEAGEFWLERTQRNPYVAALKIDLVDRVRGYFMPRSIAWVNAAIDLQDGSVLGTEDGFIVEI